MTVNTSRVMAQRQALPGYSFRAVLVSVAIFSDAIFFGLHGAIGAVYTGDEASFRLYKIALAGLAFCVSFNSAVRAVRTNRVVSRRALIYTGTLTLVAASVFAGLIRSPESDGMERLALLFVTLTIPLAILALSVQPTDIDRLTRPLIAVATGVSVLLLVGRIRGAAVSGESLEISTATAGIGGASHLTVGFAMAAVFSIGLVSLIRTRHSGARVVHACNMTIATFMIVDSGSRGALVSISCVTLVMLTFGRGLTRRPVLTTAVMVGGFVGFRWLLSSDRQTLGLDKVRDFLRDGAETNDVRSYLASRAWDMFVESPILGNGVGSFSEGQGRYIYPHNLILELLVNYGMFGLIAILCWVIWYPKQIADQLVGDSHGAAIIAALSISVLSGMMFSGTYLSNGPLWLIMGIMFLQSNSRRDQSGTMRSNTWDGGRTHA